MVDVERATEASKRLITLRGRLAELQQETTNVQAEIADCLRELGVAATEPKAALAPPRTSAERIAAVLRSDSKHAFSPSDVSDALGYRSFSDYSNVRVMLSRMAKDGRARRVGHGRYRAVPPG